MQDKCIVFDRGGNPYEVGADEMENLLASGAYFLKSSIAIGVEQPMSKPTPHGLVTIYATKTGQAITRRAVDARELVRSGEYAFNPPKKPEQPAETEQGQAAETGLPILSEASTKQEIVSALSNYGIQYRTTMDKADLLALWNEFVLENEGQN